MEDEGVSENSTLGAVFTMWENTLERMKILNYEQKLHKLSRRLSRVHFVIPEEKSIGKFEKPTQMAEFLIVIKWLIELASKRTDLFQADEYDDPTIISNNLMLALRSLEYPGAINPQKLRVPYGEFICTVLDYVSSKAIVAQNFKWATPDYQNEEEVKVPDDDEEDEEDDIIEEEDLGVPDDDANGLDMSARFEASTDLMHSIEHTNTDPEAWKMECELVAPLLKAKAAQSVLGSNEWRTHVDQTVSTKEAIARLLESSEKELKAINKVVADELGQIRIKEKHINNQFSSLCTEFVEVKKRLEEYESKSLASSEVVATLNAELSVVTERLEEVKEIFESRDSGLNDASPLVKLKAAMQQLKDEIHTLDMKIGVVSQTLLNARVQDNNRLRAKQQSKAKARRSGKTRHEEDDDILSD